MNEPAGDLPPAPEPIEVDRADYDPEWDPDAPIVCEICGAMMSYVPPCKIVCSNCGYMRDCSDP